MNDIAVLDEIFLNKLSIIEARYYNELQCYSRMAMTKTVNWRSRDR
jgi:hypothetical protein